MQECKRCLLYEMADRDQYESVKAYLASMPEEEKVADDIYRQRLEFCRQCDYLLSGMCRKCGCYVEVRAAGIRSHCPDTRGSW